jgi:hypothetical protein
MWLVVLYLRPNTEGAMLAASNIRQKVMIVSERLNNPLMDWDKHALKRLYVRKSSQYLKHICLFTHPEPAVNSMPSQIAQWNEKVRHLNCLPVLPQHHLTTQV